MSISRWKKQHGNKAIIQPSYRSRPARWRGYVFKTLCHKAIHQYCQFCRGRRAIASSSKHRHFSPTSFAAKAPRPSDTRHAEMLKARNFFLPRETPKLPHRASKRLKLARCLAALDWRHKSAALPWDDGMSPSSTFIKCHSGEDSLRDSQTPRSTSTQDASALPPHRSQFFADCRSHIHFALIFSKADFDLDDTTSFFQWVLAAPVEIQRHQVACLIHHQLPEIAMYLLIKGMKLLQRQELGLKKIDVKLN